MSAKAGVSFCLRRKSQPFITGIKQVEEDEIAAPLAIAELPQRLRAVGGAERVVTGVLQDGRDRVEGVGIVLDDQHDRAANQRARREISRSRNVAGRRAGIACKVVVRPYETRRSISIAMQTKNQESP